MRKMLTAVIAGLALAGFQTAAMAQSAAPGTYAYCTDKWSGLVATHATGGQSGAQFMDKCTDCEAKWDAMVAANATGGMSREEYLRKCSKGIAWLFPGFALLGAGAAGIIAAGSGGHHEPVSP
jgi:hypothetical protein